MPLFGKNKKDKKKKGKSDSDDVEDKDDESPLEITDSDDDDDDDDLDDDDESSDDDDDDDGPGGSLMDDDDDDDALDSDLMDIFSGEAEEVDIDLAALTEGLQPVEAADILVQAQGVVAALRSMRNG